ncbi:hypothetical protein [Streptomyces sennicomposti]
MPEVPFTIASVTLTGRYIRPDGTPLTGTLTFEPPAHLTFPDADIISVGLAVAELDSTGAFSINLIATDAAGGEPSDWTYTVVERLHQTTGRTFHLALPAATPVVDLADIAPTDPSQGDYVVVTGPAGRDGSVIHSAVGAPSSGTGDDGDYYIDVTPGTVTWYGPKAAGTWPAGTVLTGSGSAPVTSVAGKTGAVTLVAADVSGVATPSDVSTAVSAHTSAADPHGDRAAASAALSAHVSATDPHGDRAAASTALASHVSASDPHGDRAAASSALSAHVTATDPHGDRADAAAKYLPLAGGTMTGGLTSAQASATATAFAFGLASDTFDRARILASGRWELGSGTAARDTQWYRQAAAMWGTDSDIAIRVAGKGLQVAEGTNAKSGVATMSAGTVTVSTTAVTANSRIQLTIQSPGGTVGSVYVNARTAGSNFTIKSTSSTDTSVVAWLIVEPAP